jgi:hypothetical protein
MGFAKIVGIGLAILAAAFVGFAWYVTSQAELYQTTLGPALERELGFAHGSPYVRLGEQREEVFTLHPVPGGVLAAAGLRSGDIVRNFGITGFYKHLHQNRGAEVTVLVMDGGNGPPADQRAVRKIVFRVPPAK